MKRKQKKMKRSRDDGGDEHGQEEDQPITAKHTEKVFVLGQFEDGHAIACVAEFTEAEIALLVPEFVESVPSNRDDEIRTNGPAAIVLKKFHTYVKQEDTTGFYMYEATPVKEVRLAELAKSRARTIVWDEWE